MMRRLARQGWAALVARKGEALHGTSAPPSILPSCLQRQARSTATSAGATTADTGSTGSSAWNPLSAVMFIPSAVCGCLAYWQYERMQWKNGLIQLREGISTAEPADLFSLAAPQEYDKVAVRGRFLHEYSLYVGPRPRSVPGAGIQSGYLVITPMVAEDRKGVVLVNRGWVPASWKAEAQQQAAATIRERESRAQAQAAPAPTPAAAPERPAPEAPAAAPAAAKSWWRWGGRGGSAAASGGADTAAAPAAPAPAAAAAPPARPPPEVVVGVLQPDEQANQFMPANQPESEEFHSVQREALTRALGLPPDTPLVMAISTDPAAAVAVQKRSPLQEARAGPLTPPADPSPSSSSSSASASPYPLPKHAGDLVRFSTMPGDHLNYALIWVTLCVTLAAMARTAVTKPLRGPRIVEEAGRGAQEAWKASQAS